MCEARYTANAACSRSAAAQARTQGTRDCDSILIRITRPVRAWVITKSGTIGSASAAHYTPPTVDRRPSKGGSLGHGTESRRAGLGAIGSWSRADLVAHQRTCQN